MENNQGNLCLSPDFLALLFIGNIDADLGHDCTTIAADVDEILILLINKNEHCIDRVGD